MSETRQLFKLQDLRGRLAEHNYKMTPQRKEILQIFIENCDGRHLSAEEVHDLLREKDFDFGLATVYRNVELLTSLGILDKIDFGDGRMRYELSSGNPQIHQHHHLICLKCKKVIEFEEDFLDDVEKIISEKSEFQILNHEVKFFGYCKDCRE
ncbi:MAG: transcriptional repressor [Selenomonadaceae bacterium]|nr:transcriptional repressor [Selenomonadaceae bacterium]